MSEPEDPRGGSASSFLNRYHDDPAFRDDPAAKARHAALSARSSVCSYCGVGCPYGVRKLDLYSRLEDEAGQPIFHALLREHAGRGVQWQGDGRYGDSREVGEAFPGLRHEEKHRAKLVRPPEEFQARLLAPRARMRQSEVERARDEAAAETETAEG